MHQFESPALKTLNRLERRLQRYEARVLRRPYYRGMSIHYPRKGDYFLHTFQRDVRVLQDGSMRWAD